MPDNANADNAIRTQLGLQAPRATATPAPAPSPAPAPAATPAEDPRLEGLLAQVELQRQDNDALRGQIGEMQSILQETQRVKTEASLQLPKEEELDGIPRVEAIRKVAEVIVKQQLGEVEGILRRMAPDLVKAKHFVEESELRTQYPGLNLEKYRPRLNQIRMQRPGLPAEEAIRLIADPRDLLPQETTPLPQDGFHVGAGRGAAPAASRPAGTSQPAADLEADLQAGLVRARQAGDRNLADVYLQKLVKGRPDVPARRTG